MMNERIKSLLVQCTQESIDGQFANPYVDQEKFAKALLQDCIENLEFHGHEDAISQLRWHAQSKYSLILD
jgi:hypothetical protein